MPTLRFPFHLANHNKDAAINILIIFISIGSIIFNVNYFHTTIVKNGQIINQPTNAFQSDFSLAALWRNENHAGVKDANPVAVNQETPKEGANKQVISSQVDSLIKISRIWADFFP
ncbi:hypothetical protein SNB53_01070, partial [Escherichia coli]|nr:hypothetical protein [Escherichia coli]